MRRRSHVWLSRSRPRRGTGGELDQSAYSTEFLAALAPTIEATTGAIATVHPALLLGRQVELGVRPKGSIGGRHKIPVTCAFEQPCFYPELQTA